MKRILASLALFAALALPAFGQMPTRTVQRTVNSDGNVTTTVTIVQSQAIAFTLRLRPIRLLIAPVRADVRDINQARRLSAAIGAPVVILR